MMERDFTTTKKDLFTKISGNTFVVTALLYFSYKLLNENAA